MRVDVAIVGGGGAGLSLLRQMALHRLSGLTIAVIDPVEHRINDRTWCFWHTATDLEAVISRSWTQARLIGQDSAKHRLDLTPLRYSMVRSADFYEHVGRISAALDVRRLIEPVLDIDDGPQHATVHTPHRTVQAQWVFDSRPADPAKRAGTVLLQHFRGWTLRTHTDMFDPDCPTLMDFSVAQPERGIAFGYTLPLGPRHALVEYTEFSQRRLSSDGYDRALASYIGHDVEIESVEDGAIPMTDGPFRRRVGRRIMRIGSAGGATRPSTGYTFAAMQRQSRAIARLLSSGQTPVPPRAYPRRHVWMDAVMLRALDRLNGPDFLTDLFARNRPERLLRFLDGTTPWWDDLAVMATAPLVPMMGATAADLGFRIRRAMLG